MPKRVELNPIPFWSFGVYRRFCWPWWKDLGDHVLRGWWWDARAYWHRARYGWAPRDTSSFDSYLSGVLGGALLHLAETGYGTPCGYPNVSLEGFDPPTDHEQWTADLRRWALVFQRHAADDYYEIHGTNYDAWHADEKARSDELHQTLREMEPWWEALST